MSGGLINILSTRMRRAAYIFLPASLVIAAGALVAAKTGFATAENAGGFLALSFVLFICGAILAILSWVLQTKR